VLFIEQRNREPKPNSKPDNSRFVRSPNFLELPLSEREVSAVLANDHRCRKSSEPDSDNRDDVVPKNVHMLLL